MRVWLIRHGAVMKPPDVTVGAGDPPLSEDGREHARRLSVELASRPLRAVWASDRWRALETARIIAAPHRLQVHVTRAMRELDFGAWEGRDLRDLWREAPEAARAWEADITDTPDSFGESVRELEARVRRFWSAIGASGETAVVAHRGSLAALQSVIEGRAFAESFRSPSAWVEAKATRLRPGRSASR